MKGHNSTRVGGVSTDQLKSIISRIEKLDEQKAEIAADIREIFAESKANGFCVKSIRTILKMRKKDASEIEEEQNVLVVYLAAMDMLPLFESVES